MEEVGGVGRGEDVSRDDASDVACADLPRGADGATVVAAEVHLCGALACYSRGLIRGGGTYLEPADDDGHGSVDARRSHEERAVLHVPVVVDVEQDGEASDRDADRDQREQPAVSGQIREISDQHGESEAHGPRRHRVQLRLDGAIPVRLDDRRRKVGVAVGRYDEPEVHEPAKDEFVVLEAVADVLEGDLALSRRLALVVLEAGFHESCFGWREPLGFLGEVRDNEEEGA